MPETRRRYDTEFREGGVQHVTEPNRSIVACPRPGTRDPGPGTNEGTLGNWVVKQRKRDGADQDLTVTPLRRSNNNNLGGPVESQLMRDVFVLGRCLTCLVRTVGPGVPLLLQPSTPRQVSAEITPEAWRHQRPGPELDDLLVEVLGHHRHL